MLYVNIIARNTALCLLAVRMNFGVPIEFCVRQIVMGKMKKLRSGNIFRFTAYVSFRLLCIGNVRCPISLIIDRRHRLQLPFLLCLTEIGCGSFSMLSRQSLVPFGDLSLIISTFLLLYISIFLLSFLRLFCFCHFTS